MYNSEVNVAVPVGGGAEQFQLFPHIQKYHFQELVFADQVMNEIESKRRVRKKMVGFFFS